MCDLKTESEAATGCEASAVERLVIFLRHKVIERLKRVIMWRGYLYRFTMRVSHRFNWHYAPPIYLDGDTQLWCKWCGFRATVKCSGDRRI